MNYRINIRIVAVVVTLILIATGLFVYTIVSAPAVDAPAPAPVAPQDTTERILTARHQYRDGIHTIVGEAEVPTPCHQLDTQAYLLEGDSVAEVRFSPYLVDGVCPNSIAAPFTISFTAPASTTIQATWGGVPVRLNLIPVPETETITGDVYIKG